MWSQRGLALELGAKQDATSGVAVFTVGLTLAAHPLHLSKAGVLATLGRITVQTAVLFVLLRLPSRP
jgi:hypothetical protein